MIDLSVWTEHFLSALQELFEERVFFVGLQGSYGRGEATENSDIDMVVILDDLSVSDVQQYDAMLNTLPHRELICGFLSGKRDLLSWEPADLFQFYHDTTPLYGSLDPLLPLLDAAAVSRAIQVGVCNIYHGCVHNMLYDKSHEILRGLYKSASFVIQAIAFRETGTYFRRQKDLVGAVSPAEAQIVDIFLNLKNGGDVDFVSMSETLFVWSQKWIGNT